MKTLITLLPLFLQLSTTVACVDTEEDPIESEATSAVLSYCSTSTAIAWHTDDYTGQCCTNGYALDKHSLQVCCPPDSKAVADQYAAGGYSCQSTVAAYTAVEGNPVGTDGDAWVRWQNTNYWYLKSDWQKWGYATYKLDAAAMDLAPAVTSSGERCGNITRIYRDGSKIVVVYKYCGSRSYYRYANNLFDSAWSSLSFTGFTFQ